MDAKEHLQQLAGNDFGKYVILPFVGTLEQLYKLCSYAMPNEFIFAGVAHIDENTSSVAQTIFLNVTYRGKTSYSYLPASVQEYVVFDAVAEMEASEKVFLMGYYVNVL